MLPGTKLWANSTKWIRIKNEKCCKPSHPHSPFLLSNPHRKESRRWKEERSISTFAFSIWFCFLQLHNDSGDFKGQWKILFRSIPTLMVRLKWYRRYNQEESMLHQGQFLLLRTGMSILRVGKMMPLVFKRSLWPHYWIGQISNE